jgi:UDP-glucose 4-epimerase
MKAIVTGANGFVGSALVKRLLDQGFDKVLCLDKSFANRNVPICPQIECVELSVADIEKLESSVSIGEYDLFYHFAWLGSAGPLRMDEKVQIQNAQWTIDCLKVAKAIGCKRFICAGSITEFEAQAAIYTQESKPGMAYIYGVGKILAHEMCKPIANELGIELVWAYITNAYGVGEKSPRLINSTLSKIINGEKLEFTSGTQNYDFVYIDDVAYAFYLLGMKGKANKAYLIGSGHARPLKEFLLEITNAFSKNNPPMFGNVPFTGVNLPIETYSIDEIQKDCDYSPSVSFIEGTKRTMDWLKEVDK